MPIQLYIFDWSGTLSDDRKPVYEANMRLLSDYGKPRMTYDEWLPRTTASPVSFLESLAVHEKAEEIYRRYTAYYKQVNAEGIAPLLYPETVDTLMKLREQGKIIAIVSTHPEELLSEEITRFGIGHLIDYVRGSARDKAPAITEIGKLCGVTTDQTMYTGDTIYDIRWAKEAGVRSAGVGHGYHDTDTLRREGPDYLLGSLLELTREHNTPEGNTCVARESYGSYRSKELGSVALYQ